jgi:hypothetical protein
MPLALAQSNTNHLALLSKNLYNKRGILSILKTKIEAI